MGYFTQPVVCVRGKPGQFLVFQNQFSVRVRFLFLGRVVYLFDTRPVREDIASFPFAQCDNADDIHVTVDKQTSAFPLNLYIQ